MEYTVSKTRSEILSQYDALAKTLGAMTSRREEISRFFAQQSYTSITFIGSGSSFCIAKSAAEAAGLYLPVPAYAACAGDWLLGMDRYGPRLQKTLVVSLSRSGNTSEILLALEKLRQYNSLPYVSICEQEGSAMAKVAALNLEFPWAFDESVCQTRSVTNLYAGALALIAILADNNALLESMHAMVSHGDTYMQSTLPLLEEIAPRSWKNVVTLADGELAGMAEEGALAFKEIAMIPASSFRVLDVRHGPIVLIDRETLVILTMTPGQKDRQQQLVRDLQAKGAAVLVLGHPEDRISADWFIPLSGTGDFASLGIPMIFVPQMLACLKAEALGINPDLPAGLDACVTL